jgi:hypothetical protein
MTPGALELPVAPGSASSARARVIAQLVPILVAIGLLTLPAVFNGFPLGFEDTGRYIDGGIRHYLPSQAPIFYGVFMLPLHLGGVSLWPVVVAQCLIAAHLLQLVLHSLGVTRPHLWLVPIAAFLTIGSSLPWYADFLMPDFFTPVIILCLYLLAFRRPTLAPWQCRYVWVLASAAISMHLSHLPLAFGLAFCLIAMRPRSALWLLTPPLLALIAILGMNIAAKGRVQLSEDSGVFQFARVFADGPGRRYMHDHCAERRWALCGVLDQLPGESDKILWAANTPLWQPADRGTIRREAAEIARGAILEYPLWELRAAVMATGEQLASFATVEDFSARPATESFFRRVVQDHFPAAVPAFEAARQQQGTLPVDAIDALDIAVVLLSLSGAAALCILAWRRGRHAYVALVVTIGLGLLGNAATTGGLSAVHHRYQARLVWLIPFAFAAGVAMLREDARSIR